MQILEFIFQSFWHFLGIVILICLFFEGTIAVIANIQLKK